MEHMRESFNVLLDKIPDSKLVAYLQELRSFKLKVKELGVEKSAFNYLKRLGMLDGLFMDEQKGWQHFNMTERVLIKISEILWHYGYNVEVVRSINAMLLSDDLLQGKVQKLMSVPYDKLLANTDGTVSFIEYSILNNAQKNRIKSFTNLDALIILSIELNAPVSLVIDGLGTATILSEVYDFPDVDSFFHTTFLSIPIKAVFDTYIKELRSDSPLLNPNETAKRRVDTLLRKGFDVKTIREVEYANDKVQIEEHDLPTTANIAKVKSQFANQDILIKVRNSKIQSIKQLKITKHE